MLAALVERNGFDTADVDDVIWGTSSQVCEQSGDLGRMAALDAGYDVTASGVTLDRFCGSGITANNYRGRRRSWPAWRTSSSRGGTEMMSLPKKGLLPMGANNAHLQEIHPQSHQGVCADAIATHGGHPPPTRSTRSRPSRRPAPPRRSRRAASTRASIPVLNLDGTVALDHEEFPRPGTTAESLAALPPSFPAVADYRHTRTRRRSAS